MRFSSLVTVCSAALAFGAGSAFAGGVVNPVVDAAPIEVTPVVVAPAPWAGGYVGGSIGYSFGTEDEVGLALIQNGTQVARETNLGDVAASGATAGVQVGYRWQRGNWVFGPELGVEVGAVDETVNFTAFGSDRSVDSEVNNIVTLVMKTGYAVDPATLVYGTLGVARGDFDYTLNSPGLSDTQTFNATGVAAGLGAERAINDRMSVFAEYQYRAFGNEDVTFTNGGNSLLTKVSTDTNSIKVGANFKF